MAERSDRTGRWREVEPDAFDNKISLATTYLHGIRTIGGMQSAIDALRHLASGDVAKIGSRHQPAARVLLRDFEHLREHGLDEWRAMQTILR